MIPRLWALLGMGLLLTGCAGDRSAVQSAHEINMRSQADAIIHEARSEVAALRSELAAARILVAKKEAEVQDLRRQIIELRKSEVAMRQVSEAHQVELIGLKGERDQLIQAKRTLESQLAEVPQLRQTVVDARGSEDQLKTELKDIKTSVAVLSTELDRLKKELPHARAKTAAKQNNPLTLQSAGSSGKETQHGTGSEPTGTAKVLGGASSRASAVRPVDAPIDLGHVVTITVRQGESLLTLSKKYGLTMEQLKAMNGLVSNSLVVGQQLRVPEPSPAPLPLP